MPEGESPKPSPEGEAAEVPARGASPKSPNAFRTIGEVSSQTGIAQHILRYWESRFSQLRPVTRAGNRRYYRPDDLALIQRIDRLLNQEGYTVRGVQQLLTNERGAARRSPAGADLVAIAKIRDLLRAALVADRR